MVSFDPDLKTLVMNSGQNVRFGTKIRVIKRTYRFAER